MLKDYKQKAKYKQTNFKTRTQIAQINKNGTSKPFATNYTLCPNKNVVNNCLKLKLSLM